MEHTDHPLLAQSDGLVVPGREFADKSAKEECPAERVWLLQTSKRPVSGKSRLRRRIERLQSSPRSVAKERSTAATQATGTSIELEKHSSQHIEPLPSTKERLHINNLFAEFQQIDTRN